MSFRIPALILAAVAYGIWHNGLISLAIIAVSIPLPWMAVLIANDRPPRRAEEPRRYNDVPAPHPAVPDGRASARIESGLDAQRRNHTRPVRPTPVPAERNRTPFSAHSQVVATFLHVRGCEMATSVGTLST